MIKQMIKKLNLINVKNLVAKIPPCYFNEIKTRLNKKFVYNMLLKLLKRKGIARLRSWKTRLITANIH